MDRRGNDSDRHKFCQSQSKYIGKESRDSSFSSSLPIHQHQHQQHQQQHTTSLLDRLELTGRVPSKEKFRRMVRKNSLSFLHFKIISLILSLFCSSHQSLVLQHIHYVWWLPLQWEMRVFTRSTSINPIISCQDFQTSSDTSSAERYFLLARHGENASRPDRWCQQPACDASKLLCPFLIC